MSELDRNKNDGIDDLSPDELLRRLLDKVESEKAGSAMAKTGSAADKSEDDAVNELFDSADVIDADAFDAAFADRNGEDEPVFEDVPTFADEKAETSAVTEAAPYKTVRYRVTGHIRDGVDLLAKKAEVKTEPIKAVPAEPEVDVELEPAVEVPTFKAPTVESAVAVAAAATSEFVSSFEAASEDIPAFKAPDYSVPEETRAAEEVLEEPTLEAEEIYDTLPEENVAAEAYVPEVAADVIQPETEKTAEEVAEIAEEVEKEPAEQEKFIDDEDLAAIFGDKFTVETYDPNKAAEPEPAPASAIEYSEETEEAAVESDAEVSEEAVCDEEAGAVDMNGDGKIDDDDIQLMLALGLEDQLSKTATPEAITRVTKKISDTTVIKKVGSNQSEARFTEYVNHAQTREIIEEYAKSYGGAIFSVIAAAVLALGLFFYENISIFGITLSGPFNMKVYSLVYYMIDLQLLVLAIAAVYKNFFNGIKGLFTLKPEPDSILAVGGLAAIVYTVVLGAFGVSEGVQLFSFPIALTALAAALYNLFTLRREILSFNVISSKKPKYSLSLKSDGDSRTERKLFNDYIDESSTVAKVDKSSFVDGFFARTDAPVYYGNKIMLCVIIPVAAAIIVFAASYLVGNTGLSAAGRGAMLAFVLSLPATVLYTYSYPFYSAEKIANNMGGAIIGTDTLDEFSSSAILVYDDVDLFRPYGVKVRSIKIFGEHRIDRVIYDSASIFCGIGGLLGEVFKVASSDLGCSDNVEYREIVQNGISADVDGDPDLAGTRKYMLAKGVELIDDDDSESSEDCVMYLATRGEAAAKMYITYDLEPNIEFVVEELNNAGICLGINSTDPNINDEMIARKIKNNVYPIKVICRQSKIKELKDSHASSGIVSRDGVKSLLTSVILCDKVKQVQSTNFVVKILAMIIGAALAGILVFGSNSIGAGSAVAGLYQLLWFLPMMIVTKIFI